MHTKFLLDDIKGRDQFEDTSMWEANADIDHK
jgi:hypothetical protein